MTRRHLLALLAATPLAAPACVRAADEPTAAQPELPREQLVIVTHDGVKHPFSVEMAMTPEQQRTGLMFRTTIPDGTGMFFDWGAPRLQTMWMENCPVGEDMLFIGEDGTIRHIAERTVPQSTAFISSVVPVRATLEVAAGTAEKLDIRVGDKVLQRIFGNAPT
jgi:uncharacterized membrane protein (UPF0127 family)